MNQKPCYLCSAIKVGEGIICKNNSFYAVFDNNPVTPGHMIVVTQKHIENLLDLNEQEWLDLRGILTDSIKAIESADKNSLYTELINNFPTSVSIPFWKSMLTHKGINKKPDGYNFGNNQGKAAGRSVDHLHVHVIPRYLGDVENPRGGIRNIIPGMGDYRAE
jgi:diadenosine tetraphosphate (Ap4A) HIT family hydrolase